MAVRGKLLRSPKCYSGFWVTTQCMHSSRTLALAHKYAWVTFIFILTHLHPCIQSSGQVVIVIEALSHFGVEL